MILLDLCLEYRGHEMRFFSYQVLLVYGLKLYVFGVYSFNV
jgi:hypothetical protein